MTQMKKYKALVTELRAIEDLYCEALEAKDVEKSLFLADRINHLFGKIDEVSRRSI